MSETSRHNPNKTKLTRRGKAVVAGGLLLAGALGGKAIDDKIDDYRANQAQPACDIVAQSGDTIFDMKAELKRAGDDVRGENVKVLVPDEGYRERNGNQDRDFYVAGSMALKIGDIVEIQNVEPAVCETVGGHVVLPEAEKPSE